MFVFNAACWYNDTLKGEMGGLNEVKVVLNPLLPISLWPNGSDKIRSCKFFVLQIINLM
jgi:hypothetical protein